MSSPPTTRKFSVASIISNEATAALSYFAYADYAGFVAVVEEDTAFETPRIGITDSRTQQASDASTNTNASTATSASGDTAEKKSKGAWKKAKNAANRYFYQFGEGELVWRWWLVVTRE